MNTEIPVWRIKYLPNKLEDVCGRDELKENLRNYIKNKNFPHLLFIGSEGIGKTTIAKLFSKEFLEGLFDTNFKIVYANVPLTSEELKQARSEAYVSTSKIRSLAGRRITTPAFLQIKIKPFVQLKVLGGAPFKILIVKNFESLGSNQQEFRRLMEIYGTNCRMILITTKISSIIDPIISRCQIFMISPVNFTSFKNLIQSIAKKELLQINDEAIELLYKITEGKISHAIDLLQLSSISGKDIDVDKLYENFIKSQKDLMKSLLLLCFKGEFLKARELSRKIKTDYKYSSQEIFGQLMDEILKMPISTYSRSKLLDLIAEADFRALDGLDIDIQVSNLLAKICQFSEYM